jgi:hypothetical protein
MMSVDPTGQFAYETNSGPYNVSAFSIDSDTGELAEIFYLEFIARGTSHIPYKGPSGGD